MTPVYDLSTPDDRLRWALDQPTRAHRQSCVRWTRDKHGELAEQALLAGLYDEAKRRGLA